MELRWQAGSIPLLWNELWRKMLRFHEVKMSLDANDTQQQWFEREGVIALKRLGFRTGQRVLDFGCGPGRFTVPLSRIVQGNGGKVIAIDHSSEALARLDQRLNAFGHPPSVEAVLVEKSDGIEAMSVDPVDAAMAFDVLQHVESWEAFFQAACHALKPDGQMFIYPAAVPHPGCVDMDVARKVLKAHGFVEASRHHVRLPHANDMVEDTVYLFGRQSLS